MCTCTVRQLWSWNLGYSLLSVLTRVWPFSNILGSTMNCVSIAPKFSLLRNIERAGIATGDKDKEILVNRLYYFICCSDY